MQVEVENLGPQAGDEVAQLYISDVVASVPVPRLHLEGFQRFHLAAGERRTITFTLLPEQLAAYDEAGQPLVEPGEFVISVGGGQPGYPASAAVQTRLVVRR